MSHNLNKWALVAAMGTALLCATQASAADVKIIFGNVSPEVGKIYASLCDSEGYKDMVKGGCAITASAEASEGVVIVFENVAPGTWGVSSFHDENENGKLDSNMFRIPKEATGASNNAVGKYGPPKFNQIKFDVHQDDVEIAIDMRRVQAR